MAFEKISEFFSGFSIESLFKGDFSSLLPIFYLIILIAIYSIVIWHFYRFIARRDCFKINYSKHKKLVSCLKYSMIYPFVAFLFFIGFSLMMLFITRNYGLYEVLTTSFAIVTAIRISAYYSEDLSKDVAKMLPFALLGIFLIEPSYFSFAEIMDKILLLPEFFIFCIQFIILIVFVEWILRILLTIKKAIFIKANYKQDRNYKVSVQ
jgi:hypothetical protein